MSRSSTEQDLADRLGSKLPADFSRLSAAEIEDLASHVGTALDHHHEAIEHAEENIVEMVPRPARGTVRRVLQGGR